MNELTESLKDKVLENLTITCQKVNEEANKLLDECNEKIHLIQREYQEHVWKKEKIDIFILVAFILMLFSQIIILGWFVFV